MTFEKNIVNNVYSYSYPNNIVNHIINVNEFEHQNDGDLNFLRDHKLLIIHRSKAE